MTLTCRRLSLALRSSSLFALALLSLVVAARTSSAAPIIYGNKPGATVDYLGVQEESGSDPGLGLFGNPTVAGDVLDFNPQNFSASTTGLASDHTDSNLQFTVMAHDGKAISLVTFNEKGDTTLTGLVPDAETTVGTVATAEITQIRNGNVFTTVSVNIPQVNMVFAPTSDFLKSVVGTGTKTWAGSMLIDPGPAFAASGLQGVVTKVFISLDNTLTAASVQGTSAFIQKKDADGLTITVNTLPEPASAAVALIGLALSAGAFRRRR